jgi:hypothetical protein
MFGAVIARDDDYRQTFQHFRPGFDLATERLRREQADFPEHVDEDDLYPGCSLLPGEAAAARLPGRHRWQPDRTGRALASRAGPAGRLHRHFGRVGGREAVRGVLRRTIAECGCRPGEIAHVVDRLDNDIRPALAAGMVAVFLLRGPWGYIHAAHPDVTQAHIRIDSLHHLPEYLTALR